ncbi:MAG: hypothetical protein JNJ78_26565, partial [Anaerolineae bacterium]|nr:hypothetical protein [Anaerolineae bacterium]
MSSGQLSAQPVSLSKTQQEIKPQTPLQRVVRRFVKHRAAMVGLFVLLGIIIYIIGGSFVFSEAFANRNDTSIRLQAPSAEHPFGTDRIGRDILARTIYGGQISLMSGLLAVSGEVTLGTTSGAVGGWGG